MTQTITIGKLITRITFIYGMLLSFEHYIRVIIAKHGYQVGLIITYFSEHKIIKMLVIEYKRYDVNM